MEVLPNFSIVTARSVEDVVEARAEHADSRVLGGGTDLMVTVRRGIVAPQVMIDINRVDAMKALACGPTGLEVGASVTLATLADSADLARHFPAIARAAGSIAGPTHRHMGTVGGNLCLDTRCIFYNQSEWWRGALNHCLKTTGTMCHVAPKSRGVCFATFSGDLAPAFLIFGAEVEIAGPRGHRTLPLEKLYIGYARQDQPVTEELGDGKHYLALRPGEFIVSVRVEAAPRLRSGYDKIRIRRSIEYPVAGVAVALRRDGDVLAELRVAITGTNPRPVLLAGTDRLCGGTFDGEAMKALDALVLDQVMSMKTTFTPGHYRRRMASVLARRLAARLFSEAAQGQSLIQLR
jgi:4-hydroxybenzoyl-CoA reductase subunit beta